MVSPGAGLALGLSTATLAAAMLLTWLVAGRSAVLGADSRDSGGTAEWEAEAVSLTREVRRVANLEGTADRERLQRQLVPLSERLKGHARVAPTDVPPGPVEGIHSLGVDCYRVGMEHTTRDAIRSGEFVEDRMAHLATKAESVETVVNSAKSDAGTRSRPG